MESGDDNQAGQPAPEQPPQPSNDVPLTFEEKRKISLGINMLPGPKLADIIRIVQANELAQPDGNADEFELDIENLQISTLRELQRYIRTCFPNLDDIPEPEDSEEEVYDEL